MSSETQRISEPSVFIRDRKERFEPGEMAELTLAAIWISLGLTHQETPNDPHRLPLPPKALPPNGTLLQGEARKKSSTADVALRQGASTPRPTRVARGSDGAAKRTQRASDFRSSDRVQSERVKKKNTVFIGPSIQKLLAHGVNVGTVRKNIGNPTPPIWLESAG
jgi:hypothetical protein